MSGEQTQTPKHNPPPIQQPMYVGNVLHQTWVAFFESLGVTADEVEQVDLSDMENLLLNLSQQVGVLRVEVSGLESDVSVLTGRVNNLSATVTSLQSTVTSLNNQITNIKADIADLERQQAFSQIPIYPQQIAEIPPVQAVFLCPEQSFSMVGLPTGEVIHD